MTDESKQEYQPVPIWMRLASLLLGGAVLLWLPLEGRGSLVPNIIGIAAGGLFGLRVYYRYRDSNPPRLKHAIFAGLLGGLLVSIISAGLMVLKNGIHGHGVPDYSLAQVLDTIYKTPIWILGGILIGLGGGLLDISRGEF